jgi:hypothetical protein
VTLFDFLFLKKDVNVGSKRNNQKNVEKKARSGAGSGSVGQRYRSADPDPDPYQNVTDPQH